MLIPESFRTPLEVLDIALSVVAIPLEVTVIGSMVADLLSAFISFLLGDWLGVGLSLLALIPIIGSAFGIAKIIKNIGKITLKGAKFLNKSKKGTKFVKGVSKGGKMISKGSKNVGKMTNTKQISKGIDKAMGYYDNAQQFMPQQQNYGYDPRYYRPPVPRQPTYNTQQGQYGPQVY